MNQETAVKVNPDIDLPPLPDQKNQEIATQQQHTPSPDMGATLMQLISSAALNPNFDADKFERMLRLQREIQREDADREANLSFNQAFARTQAQMKQIIRNAKNPQTKSNYSDYSALDEVCRPIYTEEGFSISFDEGDGAPTEHMRCLAYLSRDLITRTYHFDVPVTTKGPQGAAVMTITHAKMAAGTYGSRRLLSNIFNLVSLDKDDDGNAAGNGPLADAQFNELSTLISDINKRLEPINVVVDIEKLCNKMGVPTVTDIPVNKFPMVIRSLKQWAATEEKKIVKTTAKRK